MEATRDFQMAQRPTSRSLAPQQKTFILKSRHTQSDVEIWGS